MGIYRFVVRSRVCIAHFGKRDEPQSELWCWGLVGKSHNLALLSPEPAARMCTIEESGGRKVGGVSTVGERSVVSILVRRYGYRAK